MYIALIIIHIVGFILAAVTMSLLTKDDSTHARKLMIFFMMATLVQNAGYLLELTSTGLNEAMAAVKIEYLGSCFVAYFFMIYVRHCWHSKKMRLLRFLLFCSNLFTLALVWSTPRHTLFYSHIGFVQSGAYPHLELSYGPAFFIFFMTGCVAIPWIISVGTLIRAFITEKNKKRRNSLISAIIFTFITLLVMLLYLFRAFDMYFDPTPIVMEYQLSFMVIFIWNRTDYDLTRDAANTALNTLSDCIITLDEKYNILTYNKAAAQIFPDIVSAKQLPLVEKFPMDLFEPQGNKNFTLGSNYFEGHIQTLEDINGKLRGYSILIIDMTETFNYIKEIKMMQEKAEAASHAKSDFLANMSHEIRTPLNAIVGMSELIIDESRGRKVYDFSLDIKSAALNLLSSINDILDISKIDSGTTELNEAEYYPQLLITDTVNLIRYAAYEKGLYLNINLSPNIPCQLFGDEVRIRQILTNLLSNAVKFTRAGSISLLISSEPASDGYINLHFIVRDTGIGIRKTELSTIFDAFTRLDMKKNRSIQGTGLGLAITKKLVDLMDGTITVNSQYGKGSQFDVYLKQRIIDERTIEENPVTRESMPDISETMFESKNYRVLVVDDNMINRKVIVKMLASYQFRIDQADCGRTALQLVKKQKYDLIFMDYMMPEMDGIETVRAIRSECGENGTLPIIIALTAYAVQGAREMCLENGFQDYLPKPFERIQLHELLNKWIPDDRKQYSDKPVQAEEAFDSNIGRLFMKRINVVNAVTQCGGVESYLELLSLYYLDGQKKVTMIRELANLKDLENYTIEAHALKSASANIGADPLSKTAAEHEKQGRERNISFITEHVEELLDEYTDVLKEIERVLRQEKREPFSPAMPSSRS